MHYVYILAMNKSFFAVICCLLSLFTFAKENLSKPKVLIGIVVDQMRPDYLQRFYHHFGETGFKRLLKGGTLFENCFINFLPSYTACGHAAIYTGSVPALHGIIGNNWYDRIKNANMYCVSDDAVHAVGGMEKYGQMSPRNLKSTTIADELRLSNNFQSRTFSFSLKDRGAILPGGHSANAAYWMDDSIANFMSSTFYLKSLPRWVQNFNAQQYARNYLKKAWDIKGKEEDYLYTRFEDTAYTSGFAGKNPAYLPYQFDKENNAIIKKTPYGNDILIDFVKKAIENENIGKGNFTDFINISFSATDYIGHQFGPHAMELEDCYARLDESLGAFLDFLNVQYGQGNYLLFLTADHGVLENPQYLKEHKIPAGYVFDTALKDNLNSYLFSKFQINNVVNSINNNQVYLNANTMKADVKENVLNGIKEYLNNRDEIYIALKPNEIMTTALPHFLTEMLKNTFNTKRSGEILFLMEASYLDAYSLKGTSHGSWGNYDCRIPLLFYGWNIAANQKHKEQVFITDIAPTLCNLLKIAPPNASVGRVLF